MNNTLVKGLGLLEVLATNGHHPIGVSELASRLDLVKSNVHRLLQALVELGYVSRDEATGTYSSSVRLWGLGAAILGSLDLRRVASAVMERLLAQVGETVHLSVLDGAEVVYLDKLDSPEPVRAYSQVGGRAPAHCVATGKAIIAFQDESRLAALAVNLPRFCANTITDEKAFLKEMRGIRQTGFAVNRGEWREGVHGVAAPIWMADGRVIAAIGISGPMQRLPSRQLRIHAVPVVQAAADISAALAGGPPGARPSSLN